MPGRWSELPQQNQHAASHLEGTRSRQRIRLLHLSAEEDRAEQWGDLAEIPDALDLTPPADGSGLVCWFSGLTSHFQHAGCLQETLPSWFPQRWEITSDFGIFSGPGLWGHLSRSLSPSWLSRTYTPSHPSLPMQGREAGQSQSRTNFFVARCKHFLNGLLCSICFVCVYPVLSSAESQQPPCSFLNSPETLSRPLHRSS